MAGMLRATRQVAGVTEIFPVQRHIRAPASEPNGDSGLPERHAFEPDDTV